MKKLTSAVHVSFFWIARLENVIDRLSGPHGMRNKWHRKRYGGRAATHRSLVFGQAVFLSFPPPSPPRFVTRPRSIFARVQARWRRRLRTPCFPGFFRHKNTHKPPASRLRQLRTLLHTFHVSVKPPTYPSPNPTCFTYYHLEQNVGLGKG